MKEIKIIEQSIVPKHPDGKCEDGIVVTNDYIAVIDGSTSKTDRRYSKRSSNGRYCMKIVARYVRHAQGDLICQQFCDGVTGVIAKHYGRRKLSWLMEHPEERLTVSAIVYSRQRREIWMIGDCHCLVTRFYSTRAPRTTYYDNPKPSEQELAEQRAAIIKASTDGQEHFLQHDTAREAILPRMIETMQGQNKTYAVIDGFPIPQQHVRIIKLNLGQREIVLASDGYPFLEPTLEASEQRLAWQREHDPLNIGQFKATKAFLPDGNGFDDRSYIRFRVV